MTVSHLTIPMQIVIVTLSPSKENFGDGGFRSWTRSIALYAFPGEKTLEI